LARLTKATNPEHAAATLESLQAALGYRFEQPAALERALTHRSFSADHNERLEFLGDAVLGLAVSAALVRHWTRMPEGELSRVRANLVKQPTLVQLAERLGLAAHLRLGSGEQQSGGRRRPSILADALEAVIGAIYSDGGFDAAAQVVETLYGTWLTDGKPDAMGKDPKTELQEWLQGRKMALPQYAVTATTGLAHEQRFEVSCTVEPLQLVTHGDGVSRREAEQSAALAMLRALPPASPPKRSKK
jgi:ribonuclease III